MPIETADVRDAVARLIVAGDFQELINLYTGGDVAATPERIARLYPTEGLPSAEREALAEVLEAIPDDLLPRLDVRATAPSEMVELAARFALERGKGALAIRALREAEALDRAHRSYTDLALRSLADGDMAQAAFELVIAARLGWASASPEARRDFITGLGVNPNELAASLGAESARGRVSGGRVVPEFPAWQTYGPLLHARCHVEPCVSDLPPEVSLPLAVRLLLHTAELAERALQTAGEALPLLRALATEIDPGLPGFAQRHADASAHYRALHDEGLVQDTRLAAAAAEAPADPEPAVEAPEGEDEPDAPAETRDEESPDKAEATREGLREVQALLLGRPEKEWRNALAELTASHPLSVFTVCTVHGGELGTFVIPAGRRAVEFLAAVCGA
ncbi:MAG: hypothetical protein FJX74_00735 [Armatimonadetes bacterium]|nr:hypothetical protein [Armatimonadota bacterium]